MQPYLSPDKYQKILDVLVETRNNLLESGEDDSEIFMIIQKLESSNILSPNLDIAYDKVDSEDFGEAMKIIKEVESKDSTDVLQPEITRLTSMIYFLSEK